MIEHTTLPKTMVKNGWILATKDYINQNVDITSLKSECLELFDKNKTNIRLHDGVITKGEGDYPYIIANMTHSSGDNNPQKYDGLLLKGMGNLCYGSFPLGQSGNS